MSAGRAGAGRAETTSRAAAKHRPSSEERALLRQLKEVTDRQRDELRAHNRDLQQRSQETEAVRAGEAAARRGAGRLPRRPAHRPYRLLRPQLQEQLQRLLLVNAELRHKLAAVQTQLRAARDRESERELRRAGALELAQDEARNLAGGPGCAQRQEPELATSGPGGPGTPEDPVSARWVRDPSQSSQGWALGKCAVLRGRSNRALEGGTQVCPPAGLCPSLL